MMETAQNNKNGKISFSLIIRSHSRIRVKIFLKIVSEENTFFNSLELLYLLDENSIFMNGVVRAYKLLSIFD